MSKQKEVVREFPHADEIPTDELMFHLVPLEGSPEEIAQGEGNREDIVLYVASRLEGEYRPDFRSRMISLVTWANLDRNAIRWAACHTVNGYSMYVRFKSQMHPFLSPQDEDVICPNDVDSRFLGWDATINGAANNAIQRRFFGRF